MDLFRRYRDTRHFGPEVFCGLTARQLDWLTHLSLEQLEASGFPARIIAPGILETEDGRAYGLHSLAATVRTARPSMWPTYVACHFAVVRKKPAADRRGAERVFLHLRPSADLLAEPDYPLWEPLPGLRAVASVGDTDGVNEVLSLDNLNMGNWSEVRDLGLGNLAALPAPERAVFRTDPGRADTTIHVLTSTDVFAASRLLVLGRYMDLSASHGAVVVVPNHHFLAVHPVMGAGTGLVFPTLERIIERETNRPGRLSSDLFFLSPDGSAVKLPRCPKDALASPVLLAAMSDEPGPALVNA